MVTLLNIHRPRDRSHYERFSYFHAAFYRAVEATSVTPFSPRALDRGLAAVVVAMARLGGRRSDAKSERRKSPTGCARSWTGSPMSSDERVIGHNAEASLRISPHVCGRAVSLLDDWSIAGARAEQRRDDLRLWQGAGYQQDLASRGTGTRSRTCGPSASAGSERRGRFAMSSLRCCCAR